MFYYIFLAIVAFVIFLIARSTYRSYVAEKMWEFWTKVIVFGGLTFYVLFVNELVPWSSFYYDYKFTNAILGKGTTLKDVYTFESPRDPLLGDGYSLYVYQIDDQTAAYFQNPSEKFFTDFPKRESYQSEWVCENWKKSPVDTIDRIFREFAIGEIRTAQGMQRPLYEVDKMENLIHKMLNEKGNYYAYSAFMHGEYSVGNIVFYVLSPKRKWLIAIYYDT